MNNIKSDQDGFLLPKKESDQIQNILDNTETLLARQAPHRRAVTVSVKQPKPPVQNKPQPVAVVRAPEPPREKPNIRPTPMQRRAEKDRAAAAREQRRQTRILESIAENRDGKKGGGLLSGLGMGAGVLKGLMRAPANFAKGAARRGTDRRFMPAGKGRGLPRLGGLVKGMGKGGALAVVGGLFGGVQIEQSGMSRSDKNKAHAKNLVGVGGGLAGAAAGAKLGALAGSVVPGAGTVLGGLLGGALGALAGTQLADYATDRLDKAIDPQLSRNMFGSWRGFTDGTARLWHGFTANTNARWKSFSEAAQAGWNDFSGSLKTASLHVWQEMLPKKFTDYFADLGSWGKSAWGKFSEQSASYWDSVKSFAQSAWQGLSAAAAPYVEQAKAGVSAAWESAKQSDVGQAVGKGLDIAKQKAAEMVQDVQTGAVYASRQTANAAKYAMEHALPGSAKQCAKYVNNALKAQGIRSYGHGRDVAGNLLRSKQGFHEVKYSKDYVPQIGDVMSMPSHRGSSHNYGHVAIYTEKGWVSDFKQGEKYGNTAAANKKYWRDIQAGVIKPTIARKSSVAGNVVQGMKKAGNAAVSGVKTAYEYGKAGVERAGAGLSAMFGKAGFNSNAKNKIIKQTFSNKTRTQAADRMMQGFNGGSIEGMNANDTAAYAAMVAATESGFNYKSLNQYGYAGAFQMGVAALEDIGLMKKGTAKRYKQSQAAMQNPNNWTIKGGLDAFLGSEAMQHKAFVDYTNKNIAYLRKGGLSDSQIGIGNFGQFAFTMKAAHLKGHGGAKNLVLRGVDSRDANGQSAREYGQHAKEVSGLFRTASAAVRDGAVPVQQPAPRVPKVAAAPKPPVPAQPLIIKPAAAPKQNTANVPTIIASGGRLAHLPLSRNVENQNIAWLASGGLMSKK